MNAKLFFLSFMLIYGCTNMNKQLTDAEKNKIVGEVKVVISTVIQVCENPDPEKLKSLYLNSPDFVSMVGGVWADYDQSIKGMYGYLSSVTSQKSTIKNEKFVVLDATTVLYSANSRWEAKTKNDSTVIMDPLGMQFLLKKIDNQWKVISWTEAR
jgi:hypothetical protein